MSSKTKATAAKEAAKPALVPKLRFPEFLGADRWEKKTIGQVCKSFSGGTPNTAQKEFYGGGIPFIRSAEIDRTETELFLTEAGLKNSAAKLVAEGDVLVALYGANSGDVALARIDGAINQAILCLKSEQSNAFVHQFLSLRKNWIIATYLQGGQGNLSGEIVKSISLGFPKLSEQQKIAECLSSVDELLAAQARKVDALKTHKKGLMQQLFPREGETQPRLRFPEFQNTGEWKCMTLKGIANITSGSTPLRSNLEFFAEGTIPWVKTTDLNNSFIVDTEEKITPKAKARVNPAGSVLIAMYGGFNQIGRTGCLSFPAATNQAISVLALDRKTAIPAYVLAWLNAKVEDWKRIASSSRKDPNITSSDVAQFTIVLPELDEQQRIASCLSSLDALITAETQKLAALKTHKKGLMQQLFPSPEGVEA